MSEIIVTHGEKSLTLAHLDFVRLRLEITRRRRAGISVEAWTRIMPIVEAGVFAASRRVEDLLPLRLVEIVTTDWGGSRNTWTPTFSEILITGAGELVLDFTYSVAASKSWPLERCLMGMGWSQERQNASA